jgi:aryl-alcohol dehydrogenase-like predicted oxidoreductase
MAHSEKKELSRRSFFKATAAATAGIAIAPLVSCSKTPYIRPVKRTFGRLGFEVTTMGLGGQASLQWMSPTENPQQIILKAFKMGVNYFDTSNLYGPSQSNYGRAFRKLNLVPGRSGYDESMRRSIFLTSKTHLRWGKGQERREGVGDWTDGHYPENTAYDVRRSLSQIFGDGAGGYPEGAYLDMVLIHSLTTLQEVDLLYTGIENTSADMENIGALAVLRDLRDGTNLTGQNPKEEKLIRHIGFSGHYSAPVMMEMIRRDQYGILDGMLVAINANDKRNLNMQHNVIPVAKARDMGVIAMKVFADGAMYTKGAHWSGTSEDVVRTVGSESLPSRPLIEYALTTPGVHTAIIGIGHIDDDPDKCQLYQNIVSAQIEPDGLGESDRKAVEELALTAKEGKTNYFQISEGGLSAPQEAVLNQAMAGDQREVTLSWNSAWAGDEAVKTYEVWKDGEKLGEVSHVPQADKNPFIFNDRPADRKAHTYKLVAVDAAGKRAEGQALISEAI